MFKQLEWAKKLQAISQAGHTYSKDKFDLERFDQIQQIAFEMLSEISDEPIEKIANLLIPETGYPTPKVDVRAAGLTHQCLYFEQPHTFEQILLIQTAEPALVGHA